jgi:P-type Ca2+ transporter type 2C
MAFTTLMLFQILNVINARSDDISAFVGLFTNQWLWAAMALSVALQATVVYVPVLEQAFGTVGLSAGDWLRCIGIASSVLWVREMGKLFAQRRKLRRARRPR